MMSAWPDSPRTRLPDSPPSRMKSPSSNPSRRWSFRQPQRHGEATRFGIIRRLWASALAAAGPSDTYLFSGVELVALRRVAPRAAAQRLPANGALRASRSAAARGGVVAARQPLPLNRYDARATMERFRMSGAHPVPLLRSPQPFAQLVELLPERARQSISKLREVRRDVVGFFLPTRDIHGKKVADVLGGKIESREIQGVRRRQIADGRLLRFGRAVHAFANPFEDPAVVA